jgi:dihydroorotate dehydrogenase electron transfer subunit
MARIIVNRNVSPGYYRMRMHCPGAAARSKPGQFVMVRAGSSIDPLLRRPFAVHRVCGKSGATPAAGSPSCIEILYRLAGKGTLLLSRMRTGEEIDLLGPLGIGFSLPRGIETAVLVAGGIGVAPLLPLAQFLGRRKRAVGRTVIIGGATRGDILCRGDFKKTGARVVVSTEDGSAGVRGLATDLLEQAMDALAPQAAAHLALYACGPLPMLQRVAAMARERGVSCQVSLESTMACGVGACLGCSVPVRNGRGRAASYQRVCREGPVFDSAIIDWDCLAGC